MGRLDQAAPRGGLRRVVRQFSEDVDYPSAEIATGFRDIDNVELIDTASNLRGMGTIVQKDCYSWIAQSSGEVPPYVEWTGYNPPSTISLAIDDTWAKANQEWHTDGTYNDAYIILDGWPIDKGSRSCDPKFTGPFSLSHASTTNVNDPPTTTARSTAYRPSSWTGSGGLTVDGGDNDVWTVAQEAQAPKATRDLVTIWFDRQDAVKVGSGGGYEYGNLPQTYLVNQANLDEDNPSPADDKTREDVTNWDNYSYLRVGFDVPETATLAMKITWREITGIGDNFMSDSTRIANYTYSTETRTAEYDVAFTSTGSQYVDVDLIYEPSEGEAVKIQHVDKIEFTGFPTTEETEWELETLELREEASDSFRTLKMVEPWRYVDEVGVTGVVDGKQTLALPGCNPRNREDGVPIIDRRIGAQSGLDLSVAFTLAQMANILHPQEGYAASFSQSSYDDHTKDVDNNVLCTPRYWQLQQQAHRDEYWDGWSWPLAIRVRSIKIVAGITYAIHAQKLLRLGTHGVAWDGTDRDSTATIYLWKCKVGDSTWTSIGSVNAGDLGYWRKDGLIVLAIQGGTPPAGDVKYEYGASLINNANSVWSLGIGFNREWICGSGPLPCEGMPFPEDD